MSFLLFLVRVHFLCAFGLSTIFLLSGCHESQQDTTLLLPDDLEATLWAESPMVYNPTNMDCDSRGRLWVTEAVNYRNYNNDSSTFYHHPKGDRVVILEDTDDDGVADRSKVFVQDKDLVSPLGIAVVGNRIFVSCSPHLIVYTDEDGDDEPDHKEIFLTGFGGEDHDHSLHSLVGGPDGNLYFTTGNAGPHQVTDQRGWTLRSGSIYTGGSPYNTHNEGNLKSDDGRTLVGGLTMRIDPKGGRLNVLAHNFRNSYEVFVDSRGDLWQNDNDDQVVTCRTAWIAEGGNAGYFSADGTRTWQADHRPGQDIFSAHWHQNDPGVMPAGDNSGAGAPTGVVMIEGDELGESYRGMLLSADAGRNTIFGYFPEKKGSGYALPERINLITSLPEDNVGYVWNDSSQERDIRKWFRPSDISIGTDGALYVADWYDPVVGGHQMQDTLGYGRIYRITPKGKTLKKPRLDLTTVQGQFAALTNPAINVRFDAASKLRQQGESVIEEIRRLLDNHNSFVRYRAIWLLSSLGDQGRVEVERLLNHPDEETRVVAYRSLRQTDSSILPYATRMFTDPSPGVRREVVVSLTDLPFNEKKKILLELFRQYKGNDPWYLNALGRCAAGHEGTVYKELFHPAEGEERSPLDWSEAQVEVAWILHPVESILAWEMRANSESLDSAGRDEALTAIAFIREPSAARAMVRLTAAQDKWVRERAAYWVAFRQGNDWTHMLDWSRSPVNLERQRTLAAMQVKWGILTNDELPLNERIRNGRDLSKNPLGAQMLLGGLDNLELPQELQSEIRKNLLANQDIGVRLQAAVRFNDNLTSDSYSIPEIMAAEGDAASGREVFERYCSSCHRIGDKGGQIGPDLTSISQKFDQQALLDAIINPGAGIVFGYEAWTIHMRGGISYFGFLVGENTSSVMLKDLSGQTHALKTSEIISKEKQSASLMPGPAALGLTARQLADVENYLRRLP